MKIESSPAINKLIRPFIYSGTVILLIVIVWGCAAVPQLKETPEATYVRLPFVRILLNDSRPEFTISGNHAISLECIRDDRSVVYYASKPITVSQDNGLITISMRTGRIGDRYNEIIVTPRDKNGLLEYDRKSYRGMFKIMTRGVNLQIVNYVHMDDYLKGVVPPEIGNVGEDEYEAIKAQAVAARTYSMSHLAQYPDKPYDMKSDVSDQVYNGVEVEKEIVSKAIDDTRGCVIKYRDKLINAYYHSTCGGNTDDIDEVWDKPSEPYLRAVADSGYCSWSKYYHWRESYTARQLQMRIEHYLSSDRGREIHIGDITDMYVKGRTAGGRVAELTVQATDGSYTFGADRLRWVFLRSSNPELILQSARFEIETKHDANGLLTRADFIGGGYGHGVGMCQCGAIGMARQGKKFDQILKFYYTSVDITKIY
nr:SpoIID/LytB domain-containing protein [candidate division Zixibacteria bacterium]